MKMCSLHTCKPFYRVSRLGINVAILQIKKLGLRKNRLPVNKDTAKKWERQRRELTLAFLL